MVDGVPRWRDIAPPLGGQVRLVQWVDGVLKKQATVAWPRVPSRVLGYSYRYGSLTCS